MGSDREHVSTGDLAERLPGYRIHRELARGLMGVVYLAEEVGLRRKVALKVLSPWLAEEERFRRRFARESEVAGNLDHPNVIPIYSAGESDGLLYIAMRYVEGPDLRTLLEEAGPFDLDRALAVVQQVGAALDAAHAVGLVHRDVKPGNIMFDPSLEHVYLCDFGIAKRAAAPGGTLTSTGQFVGTIDYVSPEQIQGKPVDGRADVYALGCVLYQCLTGRVPYIREDASAVLWAHLIEEPPRVSDHRPELPVAVDRVVATAMAKEPRNRYATCAQMAEALAAAASHGEVPSVDASAAQVPPVDSSPGSIEPLPAGGPAAHAPVAFLPPMVAPPRRGLRTRRSLLAAVVGLVALAVGTGLFAVERGREVLDPSAGRPIVVGAGNFTEQLVLGHMYAAALRDAGFQVDDSKIGLATRELYFPALEAGGIDVFAEYLGATYGFLAADAGQGEPPVLTEIEPLRAAVTALLPEELVLLESSAAQDQDALAVTRETAERYGLETVSDLAPVAGQLVAAGPSTERTRRVGLPGLRDVYGIEFADFVVTDPGGPLTREALKSGRVHVARVFTTTGFIDAEGLVVLKEDRPLIPGENITPIVRKEVLTPPMADVLNRISAALTTEALLDLNRRVDIDREAPEDVALDFLRQRGLIDG